MENKNCSKVVQFGFVVFVVIAICICLNYYSEKYIRNDDNNIEDDVRVVSKFDDYSYFLKSNHPLYKEKFRNLQVVLNQDAVDEREYANTIAQLFLIDFYTLEDKMTNQDIGGVDFIYLDYQDNFMLNASSTIYMYVENNLYGDRKQELPYVSNVEVLETNNINYSKAGINDGNAYSVKCSLKYKKDLGYASNVTITLVHEGLKLSIVDILEG